MIITDHPRMLLQMSQQYVDEGLDGIGVPCGGELMEINYE